MRENTVSVTLLRHGPTAGNLRKCYVGGGSDESLCPEGVLAAAALPRRDGVQRVYTSDLRRTVQTAAICYPMARCREVPELREMAFGRFEGKNWAELGDDPAYRRWVDGGCMDTCPGGESRAAFIGRVSAAFTHIVKEELAEGTDGLYFVVHGGTIMALLSQYAVPERDYFFYQTPPFAGWRCTLSRDSWERERKIRLLHLQKEGWT